MREQTYTQIQTTNWDDDTVHTAAQPYCDDPTCWCHTDVDYHARVTGPLQSYSDDEIEEAYNFFGISSR